MPNEEMMNPAMPGQEGGIPAEGPDQGGKEIKKPADEPEDKEAQKDLLESMMFSPSAGDSDAMITLDKTTDNTDKDKDDVEAKNLIKILEHGEGRTSEKYQKELLDKALKDPTSVMVETERGWMTVKDAIGDGFDLTTGEFSGEPIPKVDWDGEISKLDPREQETIRRLTKPGTRQAGPSKGAEASQEGGDVIPGPTGEPVPEAAQGAPANDVGAMDEATMGGTELPLGGV